MALTFPTNPNDGDRHTQGNVTYVYSAVTDQWIGDVSIASANTIGGNELKSRVQFTIYNSTGDVLKTLYGAGEY